jgi:hypothetical protein
MNQPIDHNCVSGPSLRDFAEELADIERSGHRESFSYLTS